MNASMLRRCVHMACFFLPMASICFGNQCEKTVRLDFVNINSTEVVIDVMEHVCRVDYFPLVLKYVPKFCDNYLSYEILRIDKLYSHIITDRAFQSQDGVKVAKIYVENQHVEELSSSAFASLNYLQEIHLSRNNLTHIKNGTFSIPSLEFLDLSMNKIKSFSRFSLVGTSNLKILNLSSNFLQIFEGLPSMSKLKNLYLDQNNLTSFPSSIFSGLSSLEFLNVSHNHLKQFENGTFDHLGILHSLDVSCNDISELKSGAFEKMSSLKYLYLDQNNLTSFPTNIFAGLSSLESLNVSHNHLKQFDDGTFDHLKILHSLDMSYNEITALQYLPSIQNDWVFKGTFDEMYHLEVLNISHNQLAGIYTGSLQDLRSLINLDLSYNEISEVQYGSLDHLNRLVTLDLSHNQIRNIKGRLRHLTLLQDLNMEFNHLDYLYIEELSKNSRELKKLSLNGNEFSCEGLIKILEYSAERDIEVPNGDSRFGDSIQGIRCFEKDT